MNMTLKKFDLQLFAEDAAPAQDVSVGTEAADVSSVPERGSENVSGDSQKGANETPEASNGTRLPFSEIRKLYKEDFQKYSQGIINRRFREDSGAKRDLEAIAPVIERAARRYGLDPGDIKGIAAAAAADKSYYAELAEKNGTTPEIEERLDTSQREAAAYKAELARYDEQKKRDEMLARINDQVKETRAAYPDFDLEAEMENAEFADFVTKYPDIPMKKAYELIHMDRIMGNNAHAVAATVQQKTVNSIKSGSLRPAENGAGNGAPAETKKKIGEMSLGDLDALFSRAIRGERGVRP